MRGVPRPERARRLSAAARSGHGRAAAGVWGVGGWPNPAPRAQKARRSGRAHPPQELRGFHKRRSRLPSGSPWSRSGFHTGPPGCAQSPSWRCPTRLDSPLPPPSPAVRGAGRAGGALWPLRRRAPTHPHPPPPAPPRRGDSPRPTAGAPRARSANGRPPAGHRPQGPLTSSSSAVRGTVSGGEGDVSGPIDCCLSVLCFPLKPCSPKAGSSSSPTVETCPGRGRAGGRTSSPAPVVPWPACPVATFAGVAASKAMGGPSQCLANGHLCIAVF